MRSVLKPLKSGSLEGHLYLTSSTMLPDYHKSFISKNISDSKKVKKIDRNLSFQIKTNQINFHLYSPKSQPQWASLLSAATIWCSMIYMIILRWQPGYRQKETDWEPKNDGKKKRQNKDREKVRWCVCEFACMCVCLCKRKRGIFVSELSVCADRDVHTLLHATERLL